MGGWSTGHDGAATVRYKVFGDTLDGTYLAIDSTHAHINMPAAVMWARGLDDRPASLRFEAPERRRLARRDAAASRADAVRVHGAQPAVPDGLARRIRPGRDPRVPVDRQPFRVAIHHGGSLDEVDGFVRDVERIVREQREIFGEFPRYEPGHYTFLADYLPHAVDDGMEHRNSTVLTSTSTLRTGRRWLLAGVAHEFFHGWNVERIRPRSLEPFDLERANMSGELWLAEGFTQYYGPLTLARAGTAELRRVRR